MKKYQIDYVLIKGENKPIKKYTLVDANTLNDAKIKAKLRLYDTYCNTPYIADIIGGKESEGFYI